MRWTMHGLLDELGQDPDGSIDNLVAVMQATCTIAQDGLAVTRGRLRTRSIRSAA